MTARTSASPALARLVADPSPRPAVLLNHRSDSLAWNPEMAWLLVDFATLPPQQRDLAWRCLRHPLFRPASTHDSGAPAPAAWETTRVSTQSRECHSVKA